jgi:carboxypeptidase T
MPYLNVDEVEAALEAAASGPGAAITQLITLPNQTWEARTCHAVKVAHGGGANRPGIYLLGGVHAREWGSCDILVFLVEQLQQHYLANTGLTLGGKSFTAAQLRKIVDTADLFVFPQANPDGRHYSQTVEAMWRKNRRPAPGGGGSNPDCVGVDLNRNYDFLWHYPTFFSPQAPIQNSTDPCDHDVYIGPSAFSEPETNNVRWLLDGNPNIRFFVDLHSYAELLMYNWGDAVDQTTKPQMSFQNPAYNGQRGLKGAGAYKEFIPSADRTTAKKLATKMQAALKAVRGTHYTVEQAFSLYPTAGTSDDYCYSRHFLEPTKPKVYAYTIEWGTEFQPPYAEMEHIIQEITAALLAFCLAAVAVPANA